MRDHSSNRIAKRLAEIERDLNRARKTERAIRAGRVRPESAHAPIKPLRPEEMAAMAIRTEPPVSAPTAAAPAALFPGVERDPDLFSHATIRGKMESAAPSADPRDRKRFAHYLASGGLMGLQPLRQDRTHVRNRAIVMIVVVILVAFSLYRVFFRSGTAPNPTPTTLDSYP